VWCGWSAIRGSAGLAAGLAAGLVGLAAGPVDFLLALWTCYCPVGLLLALWTCCWPCGLGGPLLLLFFFFFSTSLHLKHNIKFRLYKIKIMHVNKLFLYNVMKYNDLYTTKNKMQNNYIKNLRKWA
jgi:hypothetical protein